MAVINTSNGKISGLENGEYFSFLGIPYAEPPVGDLRWKEPVPHRGWTGVRETIAFGSPSMQAPDQGPPGGDPTDKLISDCTSEDCLYLNVWTPTLDEAGKLPVFIWIHGGAYSAGHGGGRNAAPEVFCPRGVILVTFNYRLGILGFFAHPELSAESEHGVSGNYAHFDQVLALKWVYDNIENFGGDKNNITVGGCSAGSGSTQILCTSDLSKKYIKRAIIQSSLSIAVRSALNDNLTSLEEIEAGGVEYMKKMGCSSISELRAMSYGQLTALPESKFRRELHFGTRLGNCADGYLMKKFYSELMQTLVNPDIEYIVGNTNDEGGGMLLNFNKDKFGSLNADLFGDRLEEYLNLCDVKTDEDAVTAMRNTHAAYAGAKAFAELQSAAGRKPVYIFNFSRKNPSNGMAHHGLETRYLLNNLETLSGMNEKDEEIAVAMQEYWCSFIKSGNPNVAHLPDWKPYSSADRNVLNLDDPLTAGPEDEHALNRFTREFFAEKIFKLNKLSRNINVN